MRKAVGFYWTLPVPWAGFTRLPSDIDAAARASRTINYQRALIRRYAAENALDLIDERAFLEIAPDRGSAHILTALRPVEALCRAQNAALLLVDFPQVMGWRGHSLLFDWQEQTQIRVMPIFPDAIVIDGQYFDPHEHFSNWRHRQKEWSAAKPARIAKARARAATLRQTGMTYKIIAQTLNDEIIPSATGKAWTADSVTKLLAE